uniref:RxLR effector candidate protein n=1 Tax=Hyaloperonospora arabidopsidis (strain Emoy2) TaxID=559515 RepID=M4BDB6_HYAAE
MSTLVLTGFTGLVAGVWAMKLLLQHKQNSFVNGVASPPGMSVSHSSPGTASGNMSGSASGSMSGSASAGLWDFAFE